MRIDIRVEQRHPVGLDVDGNEPPGTEQLREQRGAAALEDADLEDVRRAVLPLQRRVPLDHPSRLAQQQRTRGDRLGPARHHLGGREREVGITNDESSVGLPFEHPQHPPEGRTVVSAAFVTND